MVEAGLLAVSTVVLIGFSCPVPCAPGPTVEDLDEIGLPVPPGASGASGPLVGIAEGVLEVTDRAGIPRLLDSSLPSAFEDRTALEPSEPASAPPARAQAPEPTDRTSREPLAHTDHGPAPLVRAEPLDEAAGAHAAGRSEASVQGAFAPRGPPSEQAAGLVVGLILIGLYHHLSKERALEHPTRRRILALLEEEPGLSTAALARRLDCCYRTTRHHLDKLAGFDLVACRAEGNTLRWCPPGHEVPLERRLNEVQRATLGLLEQDPGLHLSELARRLDVAKATAKFQLDRLAEEGYVRDEHVGPLRRFFLTHQGGDLLRS